MSASEWGPQQTKTKVLRFVLVSAQYSAGISNDARVEIHTQAALQSTNFNDTCPRRAAEAAGLP
jgi:hypothetical protein